MNEQISWCVVLNIDFINIPRRFCCVASYIALRYVTSDKTMAIEITFAIALGRNIDRGCMYDEMITQSSFILSTKELLFQV